MGFAVSFQLPGTSGWLPHLDDSQCVTSELQTHEYVKLVATLTWTPGGEACQRVGTARGLAEAQSHGSPFKGNGVGWKSSSRARMYQSVIQLVPQELMYFPNTHRLSNETHIVKM